MSRIRIGSLLLLVACAASALADEQPKVSVIVTPQTVTEGQSVQLRIEVEAPQSEVVFQPTFESKDFLIVGSQPNYGGSPIKKFVGGQPVPMQKTFFEYVLSPKHTGTLKIRGITMKVGNQMVKGEDASVQVLPDNQPARPTPPQQNSEDDESSNPAAPNYQGGSQNSFAYPDSEPSAYNSDFTVHAAINKKKAYVGEPIVVEYWIYDFGGLRQIEVQKWPSFNGFWKEDLEITSRFQFEDIYANDEPARRAFISRYALYGLRPGKLSLDKLVIRGQYVSNIVNQGFFQTQQVRTGTHASQDLSVEILPLPTEGKPEKFSGAVGQFFLKAEADKAVVPQNNPITFTLTLQGVGNFQAIDNIHLPLPPEFEVYSTKTGSRDATPIGMRRELSGQKTFHITAVPRKAGKFRIEPLEWWYFDPESGTYKKASTNPIEVEVTPNENGAQANNDYLKQSAPNPPPAEELRPLKPFNGKAPSSSWLWGALATLFLVNASLGVRALGHRGKKYFGFLEDPFTEAKAEFARAKATKDASWLTTLEEAIYMAAEVLLGTNPRGLTRSDLEAAWREKKLSAPLFNRIALVLDRLDLNRFSATKAMDGSQRQKLMQEVEEILKEAPKAERR
jgi:hypothetical protein